MKKEKRTFKQRVIKCACKVAKFLHNKKEESAAMIVAGAYSWNMTSYAEEGGQTPVSVVLTLLDKIILIFPAIGIGIALVGAFKLFMAFRNDQPDSYSNAIKDISIGVVLIIFKLFIWETIKGLA